MLNLEIFMAIKSWGFNIRLAGLVYWAQWKSVNSLSIMTCQHEAPDRHCTILFRCSGSHRRPNVADSFADTFCPTMTGEKQGGGGQNQTGRILQRNLGFWKAAPCLVGAFALYFLISVISCTESRTFTFKCSKEVLSRSYRTFVNT